MMAVDITGALADLVEAIKAADPDTPVDVTADPTQVRLPGILVQFAGIDLDTLQGHTVQARVLVIGQDRDDPRAVEQLETLLATALAADLEVTGLITAVGVQLPTQPSPMPALSIPVNVHQE